MVFVVLAAGYSQRLGKPLFANTEQAFLITFG